MIEGLQNGTVTVTEVMKDAKAKAEFSVQRNIDAVQSLVSVAGAIQTGADQGLLIARDAEH